MITIFNAKKILTMNPARPHATHVAVRDGLILGAGTLAELEGWGAHTLDTTFADKVLMPGLVEGHSHVSEGVFWRFVYCGYFDRMDPKGRMWSGAASIEQVVARLGEAQAAMTDGSAPLTGWALDPIYFDNQRMTRADLDRVSKDRPVGVLHASCHITNVNSKALEMAGLLRPGINHPGVPLGPDGLPTGELKGARLRAPVRAQGRHDGCGSRQPAAAGGRRHDEARDERSAFSRPHRLAARRARAVAEGSHCARSRIEGHDE